MGTSASVEEKAEKIAAPFALSPVVSILPVCIPAITFIVPC